MKYNQFRNLSCCEEFEIQCDLLGISKIDVLKEIGHQIDDYYFFVSDDSIFNWFDLNGNHIEDPGILTELEEEHILRNITKCIIPNSVIRIGDYAFKNCISLTSITIPDSVISIDESVFYNCVSLQKITIPDSVINIGNYAFGWCESIEEIVIPNSVTSIGDYAFYNCKLLNTITIPNSVTSIGEYTFVNCSSLQKITIPDSVTSIDEGAFYNCKSLKEISFKGKTLKEVKRMINYPFGIEDESIIKCER